MKAIILAAGQGTRLRPLTDHKPKCMVPFRGKPIIDYILETMHACQVGEIVVVDGYKKEVLEDYLKNEGVQFFTNHRYDSTNMVYTLFCAENTMDDDLIISYADIIYSPKVLKLLIQSPTNFSVVVDKKWKHLWELRMRNPLEDAETMKLNGDNKILELGKKPRSYDDIQGQYIGLIKINKPALQSVRKFYHLLDRKAKYDGQDFDNMFMTSFIQQVIDHLLPVQAVIINGGWFEIDSLEDLKKMTQFSSFNLS